MREQATLDTKVIGSVLDDALNRFRCMTGSNLANTVKGTNEEEKFRHMTDIVCVQKPMCSISADYYLCWHMDTLVRYQDLISKAGDFTNYSLSMVDAECNLNVDLTRIQQIFASVINKELIAHIGTFYYGNDTYTLQNSRSQ